MPKTLLLADDSVTIQKVVGITFANEDVELVTVDNGDDGLTRARQIRPDLVLADVSMPGLSGYELCSAIRSDAELATVPVLLLTGTFETYDAQRASECGADGYIAKPFEAQALIERVRNLLDRPRAPRAKPAAAPAAPEAPAPPTPAARPQGEVPTPLRPQPRPAQGEVPTPLRVQQPAQAAPPAPRAPGQTAPTTPAPRTPAQTGPTPPAPGAARPHAPTPPPAAAHVPPPRPQGQPGQAAQPPAPRPANPLPPAPGAPRPPVPATPPQTAPRPPAPPPGTGLTPPRPLAPPPPPPAAPRAPAPNHPAPASLSLNRGAPARPFPSTPAEDALDEIPEEPLTVHTPPPGLHPEGLPRGATATRVMPPPDLGDDEIFGEPIEDDDTSSTEGRTPQLGNDDAFEVEHPVRYNELGPPLDPSKSYGDLGQSFSISRETLTDPVSDAPTAPRAKQAAARAPAPQADDDSDLPWAEPEPIELDQESDDTPDDSIEAARFAERMPSPPPPPPVHDSPRAPARSAEQAPRRAAATGSPVDSRAIHESLEKVAWEAFGPLSEQIMQEVVKRVEAIAWEVLPQLAERLIREEIAHLKKSGS